MSRRLIATLLILTFLPIPGSSCFVRSVPGTFVTWAATANASQVDRGECRHYLTVRDSAPKDELPAGVEMIFESDSEVTEGEDFEQQNDETVDFACLFDRIDSSAFWGNVCSSFSFRHSIRFSKSRDVFRVLRC